jgi:eukaryotic-like serine/threonine-protein kinase
VTELLARLTTALAGRYVIERELGAGGMATVYLAHDVRHDRKVALKVLRPELSAILGGERFLKEIRTTANLQHPHILPLHDSGEADGTVFYVMPYVDGESLRDRLSREKQLPVDDAVRIAREVADALAYAHQHGIIHRDIKPENILLHGGHAMVADFGIALAASRSDGATRMTETGMSLGTPHYMSPEQAMGEREITPKADIYALGCVLYEMLTAEPPFTGATAQAIIARVMTEEPRKLTLQRRTIPPHVEAAVETALAKLPADRFATAAEFAAALGNPSFAPTTSQPAVRPRSTGPSVRRSVVSSLPWAIAALGVAAAVWAGRPRAAAPPPPVLRYAIDLADSLGYSDALGGGVAVANDGSLTAFESRSGVVLRRSDDLTVQPVPGGRGGTTPAFSPDGRWLMFRRGVALLKVSLAGGTPIVVCDSCPGYNYSWGADDTIRYHAAPPGNANNRVLMRVAAAGGMAGVLAVPESGSGELFRGPRLIPGTRIVLFNVFSSLYQGARVAVLDLATGHITRLDQNGLSPHWVDGGWIVVGTIEGAVLALPFDVRGLRVSGSPVTLAQDLAGGDPTSAKLGVGTNGTVVYVRSGSFAERRLVAVRRDGRITPLTTEQRAFAQPRFSPDGRRVAVGIVGLNSGSDVWVLDIAQRSLSRLTTDGRSGWPVWMPDGRKLVYASTVDLWWTDADGGGTPAALLAAAGSRYPGSVTPDGRSVVFYEEGSGFDGLRVLTFDSAPAARTILPAAFGEGAPALSPDGRYLAYQSRESGRSEIYVKPYPALGARVQVSVQGGASPAWSRDGRELYFTTGDTMLAASVAAAPAFAVTGRRVLFEARGMMPGGPSGRGYDVAPDGSLFVMVQGGSAPTTMVAIHHFFDRLAADTGSRP